MQKMPKKHGSPKSKVFPTRLLSRTQESGWGLTLVCNLLAGPKGGGGGSHAEVRQDPEQLRAITMFLYLLEDRKKRREVGNKLKPKGDASERSEDQIKPRCNKEGRRLSNLGYL